MTSHPTRRPRAALRTAALCAAAAALAACGAERGVQDITGAAPSSQVKFFNFGVGAPSVNFYANGTKVTAASSTSCTPLPAPPADSTCLARGVESTTGTAVGGAAVGGFYVGMAPGQYTFTGRISATADNGLAVATVPATLETGKAYSFFVSGIYSATAKSADAFVLEDILPAKVAYDTTYIRFVNAISNAGPLRLVVRNPTTGGDLLVSPTVAYKTGSTLVAVPSGGIADLAVRTASGTTDLFTRTAVSFNAGRVYTVTARGDFTVSASGTSASRPQLDNTANY